MGADIARLDAELVVRGLARSRARARELIDAGAVTVDGRPGVKGSTPVTSDTVLAVRDDGPEWVGRAALKLEAALETWPQVGVAGVRALDVGASTGGFTQVLLIRGADHVVALDVGTGQLHPSIASDPRVTEVSGTSVREVTSADLGGPFDLLVADLSFISLTKVLDRCAELTTATADLVVLVKPQFEVGRGRLARTGVVTSPRLRAESLEVVIAAAEAEQLWVYGVASSPVRGGEGNAEYLLWLRSDPSDKMEPERVAAAISELTGAPR